MPWLSWQGKHLWYVISRPVKRASLRCRSAIRQFKERLLRFPAAQLLVRTVRELGHDDASHMAAAISYYGILSLFPLLLGLIAILGLFLPSETVHQELLDFFRRNLPGSIQVLEDNIHGVIRLRGTLGLLSFLGLLWTGSSMFSAVNWSINRAWDIDHDRPFIQRKLMDIAMALSVGILFLLSLGATTLFNILESADVLEINFVVDLGTRFLGFLFSIAIFLTIYKFVPNTRTLWRNVWPGALLAAVLFEIAKSLFVLYLNSFANYKSVYGAVAAVIVLMVWIYISAFILILGAEFSSEYSHMGQHLGQGSLQLTESSKQE